MKTRSTEWVDHSDIQKSRQFNIVKINSAKYSNKNSPEWEDEEVHEKLYKHAMRKNYRIDLLTEKIDLENGVSFQPKIKSWSVIWV